MTGHTRCRMHGGTNKGAPAGNKNAVTTGRYESILLDTLDDEEQELFEEARKRQELALVEEEIGLITVRERRMLKRIEELKQAGAMTVVKEVTEVTETDEGEQREVSDRILSQLPPDDADELAGLGGEPQQQFTKVKTEKQGTLGQIQAIESALTDIQKTKTRLLDLKHKIKTGVKVLVSNPEGGPVQHEVNHGLSVDRRAAGVAALLERSRAGSPGPVPGPQTE